MALGAKVAVTKMARNLEMAEMVVVLYILVLRLLKMLAPLLVTAKTVAMELVVDAAWVVVVVAPVGP